MSFTQRDILNELEGFDQQTYHFFINLEHPYFFTAGSRLTLFADKERWAIVFEKSGYCTGNSCGEIELAYFGNCLERLESKIEGDVTTSNMETVILIWAEDLKAIAADFELVAKDKESVIVRGRALPIEQDLAKYAARRISLGDDLESPIWFPDLIRYLDEEYPSLFRATDEEIYEHLPGDLPLLMRIDCWHHRAYWSYPEMTSMNVFKDVPAGVSPSSYETYPMIADVLVSRDVTRWKPTLEPNNDWRNWPKAGHM